MELRDVKVQMVMSRHVLTVNPNDKVSVAEDTMTNERVRHLPVVDAEGALVGLVSQRDLFHSGLVKALGYGSHGVEKVRDTLLVKEVMRTEVVTTGVDTDLRDAAQVMMEHKLGCLPVMRGEHLVGILTEADFVALAARGATHLI